MAYDIVIRNGTVVDGSGLGSFRADVGIVDDRIAFVGRISERGAQEIDADGHVVTPGFIDGHTHMDAQVFWDATGSSSCWHGVTIGGHGQLRLHPGPGPVRPARPRGAQPRTGRGHRPRRAGRGDRLELRDVSRSTSTPSTDCPRASTSPPTSGTRPCAPGPWGSGPSSRRPPTTTWPLMTGQLAESLAGRRHRLLDLAERAPPDVGRPARWPPAWPPGTRSSPWSTSWATWAAASSKGPMAACPPPTPKSGARPSAACRRWRPRARCP